MAIMTLAEYNCVGAHEFENGAVKNEIVRALEDRERLLRACTRMVMSYNLTRRGDQWVCPFCMDDSGETTITHLPNCALVLGRAAIAKAT